MKTFTETQFLDPWHWCIGIIEKHDLDSKQVAEAIMAPRSTVRALFNGTNSAPRYDLLRSLLKLCIEIEHNGVEEVFADARAEEKVAPTQPSIEDFL